jgi:hypothetical protein
MRRVLAYLLLGLGAFLLVFAPLARFVVYPGVAKAPVDVYSTSVSDGPDATIFSVADLAEIDTDLTSTRITRGDVEASTDDVAVYDSFVNTADADGETRSATVERVPFDRFTGAAVEGYGSNIDGDPVTFSGQVFKLPFNAQQQDYEWWDGSLREATPMEFQAVEEIEGLRVYRFEQIIEPTKVGELDAPGELVGSDEATVPADRIYSNTRTLWVEPNTGAVVRGQEQQDSYFEVDGERAFTATQVTIGTSEETVAANVEEYSSLGSQLNLIRNVIPTWGAIVGVVLLILGFVLSARGQRRDEYA